MHLLPHLGVAPVDSHSDTTLFLRCSVGTHSGQGVYCVRLVVNGILPLLGQRKIAVWQGVSFLSREFCHTTRIAYRLVRMENSPDLPQDPMTGMPILHYTEPDMPDDIRSLCPTFPGHVLSVLVYLPPMAGPMMFVPLNIIKSGMDAALAADGVSDLGLPNEVEIQRVAGPNGETCLFIAEAV